REGTACGVPEAGDLDNWHDGLSGCETLFPYTPDAHVLLRWPPNMVSWLAWARSGRRARGPAICRRRPTCDPFAAVMKAAPGRFTPDSRRVPQSPCRCRRATSSPAVGVNRGLFDMPNMTNHNID